ncbi:SpoIIE family protein phosphatase [Pirellulales bacterium]|nr:SpoIIE family protein phosphatase [Pirellulales bacterium]
MKTETASALLEKRAMHCMEIQGGSGSTSNYFSRPGLDIWLSSQCSACAKAGGSDLYLLSSCASGRITRMLLADVCSYGSEFARTAADLRELMKKNINSIRQSRFVRQLGHQLENDSKRGSFVTMLLSTYFAPSRKFTLCNAGHALPLLFSAKSRNWSVLKQTSNKPSLNDPLHGVVGRDEYQQFEMKLEVGDLVLNYSSALAECRNGDGHTIGCEGVLSRVRRFDPYQPAQLAANLAAAIRREHPENLTKEDDTVMLCLATLNKVPWIDDVLAPLRYLKNVSDKTRIKQE